MAENKTWCSDEELVLLEQLCYLNDEVCDAAGVDRVQFNNLNGKTINTILKSFDKEALTNLRNYTNAKGGNTIDYIEGAEWADIIETIQKSDLKDFEIVETVTFSDREGSAREKPDGRTDDLPLLIQYKDPAGPPNSRIVSFRGTLGYTDWRDNVLGLNEAQSKRQNRIAKYINGLNNYDVTVVGHSKGGNYAQYVSIMCGNVVRGISMDGQGMSGEFVKSNWRSIMKNSHKVTNISVDTDFVNVLLYALPGVEQKYVKGVGVMGAAQNHSPNSLFTINDGKLTMEYVEGPAESLQMIRDFSTYVMKVATSEDRKQMAEYLGHIAGCLLGEEKRYKKELRRAVTSDPRAAVTTLAYVIKFAETYNVSPTDIGKLMSDMGVVNKPTAFIATTFLEMAIVRHKFISSVIDVSLPGLAWLRKHTGLIDIKLRKIPDLNVESLPTGVEKLGAVIDTARTIHIVPECFDISYDSMNKQISYLTDAYSRLKSIYSALLGAWIGQDQEAFQEASNNVQNELKYRIQEAGWLSERIRDVKEDFVESDERNASRFAGTGPATKESYGQLLKQAQEAVSDL